MILSRNFNVLRTFAVYIRMASQYSDKKLEVEEEKKKYLEMSLDDKRSHYKCKNKYQELSTIPTWTEYFQKNRQEKQYTFTEWRKRNQKKLSGKKVVEEFNNKISVFTGDITSLEIDAIANAANESLLGGGGVDGAIHSAAGPKLVKECELLQGCDVGDAKITGGYKLPAKYVMHTVGPRSVKPEKLQSCYRNCLNLLKENNLKSLAFPCISTGIFGYPNKDAANEALKTVREWLENEKDGYSKEVERIIFCLFLEKDKEIYNEQLQLYFPVITDSSDEGAMSTESFPINEDETLDEETSSKDKEESMDEEPSPKKKEESMNEESSPLKKGEPKSTEVSPEESEKVPTMKKDPSLTTHFSSLNTTV